MKKAIALSILFLLSMDTMAAKEGMMKARYARVIPAAAESVLAYEAYDRVAVKVDPKYQSVEDGGAAVYYITLKDSSPVPLCAKPRPVGSGASTEDSVLSSASCVKPGPVEYKIKVAGLPFGLEYPESVKVERGGSAEFKLAVDTGKNLAVAVEESAAETLDDERSLGLISARRPYHFTVSAYGADGSRGTDKAILIVGRPNADEVNVKLYRGWNLVSLPGVGQGFQVKHANGSSWFSEESADVDSANPGKYFFVYLKDEKRFASFKEAKKILGPAGFRKYLLQNAFLVYTPVEDELRFRVANYTSYDGLPLDGGWNLVPVTRDMIGRTLGEVEGSCKLARPYVWNPLEQSWNGIDGGYTFTGRDVHRGFIVKADKDCRLGLEETAEAPALPPLPED